jgi:hypothetical protein
MNSQTKFPWHRKQEEFNHKKETFNIIGDEVTLSLSDNIRFDLSANWSNDKFVMDLDRETLKGMADFILKYLENN